jgi:hypothetical protein
VSAADPADRYLVASVAANTRWAHEPDRTGATSAARAAFDRRFLDQVDPDRKLSPAERERRAANARRAYFRRLALQSARARRLRKGGGGDSDAA